MGITLGPMPFDALVELAETSALIQNDKVRAGSKGAWQPAHEIQGLFNRAGTDSADTAVVSLSGYEAQESQSTSADEIDRAGKTSSAGVVRLGEYEASSKPEKKARAKPRRRKKKRLRAEAASNSPDPKLHAPNAVVAEPPAKTVTETVVASQIVSQQTPEDSQSDESPKQPSLRPIPSPLTSPPSILPGSVSVQEVPASPSAAAPDEPTIVAEQADAAPASSLDVDTVPDPVIPPPSLRPITSTAHPPIQPWSPPVDHRRQWLIRGTALLVGASLMGVAFWLFQPDYEQASYEEFASLYEEYQQLLDASDEAGWNEFVPRARARLDESLPHLEAAAVPGERSKSILLYACRDLRSALDLSFGTSSPHARRLAGFFNQLTSLNTSSE